MSDFRNLKVWAASRDLVIACYRATDHFPKSEEFGLKSQIRRAAVAIPSNIAEGSGRHSDRDFIRFLRIAGASASELESQVDLAGLLGLMAHDDATKITKDLVRVRMMLAGLGRKLTTQ